MAGIDTTRPALTGAPATTRTSPVAPSKATAAVAAPTPVVIKPTGERFDLAPNLPHFEVEPLENKGDKRTWSLGVAERGTVGLFGYVTRELEEGQAHLEAVTSGYSAGTQNTMFTGSNERGTHFIPEWRNFSPTQLREGAGIVTPVMGYMDVGRATESRNPKIEEGALYCGKYGHRTAVTISDASSLIRLPDDVDPVLGVLIAQMGPICGYGVVRAIQEVAHKLRDDGDISSADHERRTQPDSLMKNFSRGLENQNTMVFGGGIVGLKTASFARMAGARNVVLVDQMPERLETAKKLGFQTLNSKDVDVTEWTMNEWKTAEGQPGADLVLQCAPTDFALADAFRVAAWDQIVIDLGFYQGGASHVEIGKEFHHKNLRHVCAQIENVFRNDRRGKNVQSRQLQELTAQLLADPIVAAAFREHVVTDVVGFSEAQNLIDKILSRDPSVLQVVFTPNA